MPLEEASFTVVDLETTGGRAGPGTIIEIGAWKMTGRRLVESFQTLVRPHREIPRFITGLTSISNQMVRAAPRIEDVLPGFRAFLGDSVMVAHNAAFDFSFLDFEGRGTSLNGNGLKKDLGASCLTALADRFPLPEALLDAPWVLGGTPPFDGSLAGNEPPQAHVHRICELRAARPLRLCGVAPSSTKRRSGLIGRFALRSPDFAIK